MTLQDRFTRFYSSLDLDALDALPDVYHRDVTFADPVGVHLGLVAVEDYFRRLLRGCTRCDFVIRDQRFDDRSGFAAWTMNFASPRLNGGRPIEVDGSSVLGFRDDRVESQRDYYDMGAMVYEQLPLLGLVVRYIRGRMAA
jgi:hypothetical protein